MAAIKDGDEEDDAAMKARLETLSAALDASRKGAGSREPGYGPSAPAGIGQAMNLGFRVMSEFVASVAVGGFIGWALDRWLHSSPAALILFIGLGTAAGLWSVYRTAAKPTAPPRDAPRGRS